MSLRFSVLASGSSGNASFLEVDGFGVLIDAGLGPRLLTSRLAAVGASWQRVHAVLLTHTHSDHWKDRTFAHLRRLRIPLYCHPQHHADLLNYSASFPALKMANLLRDYTLHEEVQLGPGVRCRPVPLRHDCAITTGFRFETGRGLWGHTHALAYAADLGSWSSELGEQLSNVDVLALEFNHDVPMEYASGRSRELIARVLGEQGHLSNEQAAALVGAIIRRSEPGRLRHLVQLHLSRDCNRPELAAAAARAVLSALEAPVKIHTARQHQPSAFLRVGGPRQANRGERATALLRKTAPRPAIVQALLWDD
jgi:phosphoribosyl 1,2-cyclic phosphodiesterase